MFPAANSETSAVIVEVTAPRHVRRRSYPSMPSVTPGLPGACPRSWPVAAAHRTSGRIVNLNVGLHFKICVSYIDYIARTT
jgi:hypothetical protein